mmetsp:Transcript_113728/g.302223  ORF Transcript_113728/g.302223 Transcript_113728/m.302223 type:complete len:86 (-) Transcript_113728:357-614(-)
MLGWFQGLSFSPKPPRPSDSSDELLEPISSCKAWSSASMSMRGVESEDFVLDSATEDDENVLFALRRPCWKDAHEEPAEDDQSEE